MVAHIRHRYSNYDELLMSGYERSEARAEIHDEVDACSADGTIRVERDLRQFRFFSTDGQIFHQLTIRYPIQSANLEPARCRWFILRRS